MTIIARTFACPRKQCPRDRSSDVIASEAWQSSDMAHRVPVALDCRAAKGRLAMTVVGGPGLEDGFIQIMPGWILCLDQGEFAGT